MKIVIEQSQKEVANRPNRNDPSARWYITTQPALLFKDGEKYPDKFDLTLIVTANENEANSMQPFPAGEYELHDSAFSIRNGRFNVDERKIRPVKHEKAA